MFYVFERNKKDNSLAKTRPPLIPLLSESQRGQLQNYEGRPCNYCTAFPLG